MKALKWHFFFSLSPFTFEQRTRTKHHSRFYCKFLLMSLVAQKWWHHIVGNGLFSFSFCVSLLLLSAEHTTRLRHVIGIYAYQQLLELKYLKYVYNFMTLKTNFWCGKHLAMHVCDAGILRIATIRCVNVNLYYFVEALLKCLAGVF